ncbi:B-box zinc finger protein 32 [Spatholobus suberectus]|nr:B-box zinc finger protein 32 [Spatholobus suberectus]
MKGKACELCDQQASLYCLSDSAFLCSNCDVTVHGANFLVARHRRHILCSKCNRFAGIHISGAISRRLPSTCRSCSPVNPSGDSDSLPSSSSTCESCATVPKKIKVRRTTAGKRRSCSSSMTDDASPAAKKRRRNVGSVAEELFEKWSREMGLGLGLGVKGSRVASHAMRVCLGKWTCLPFRVAAATSFWLGLRFCGDGRLATFQNLTRLEAISGVPAKLILAAHANLARAFPHRRELQEGWGES